MTKQTLIFPAAIAVIVVAGGTAVALRGGNGDVLPEQPIAFNHHLHLEKVQGIECVDCHRFAQTEAYAGIPSKDLCLECHEADVAGDTGGGETDSRFEELKALVEADGDIAWVRVTGVPDDVFFSHRRHVSAESLDCRECHADMPERTSPPRRANRMRMSACTGCHELNGKSEDCIDCHR